MFRRSVVRRTVTYHRSDIYGGHCRRIRHKGVHPQSPGLLQRRINDYISHTGYSSRAGQVGVNRGCTKGL